MASPLRILLVPLFSELLWDPILPRLEGWAEVATYDAPGVGEEPLPEGLELDPQDPTALIRWHQAIARRGLAEVRHRGWDRFVVVGDSWGNRPAVLVAGLAAEAASGLVLGHASLSRAFEGERPPMNRAVYEAMRQLLQQDHRSFVSHGLVQMTKGSVDEELAERVIEQMPSRLMMAIWDMHAADHADIASGLAALDIPMLFVQHVGCLGSTQEGFDDVAAAFPQARTAGIEGTPSGSPEFAAELRAFCEELAFERAGRS
jgi:pimeloyl-ACP methyl ester carboxylesterase